MVCVTALRLCFQAGRLQPHLAGAPPALPHTSHTPTPYAQTRIERQDAPHAASASFDFGAANAFQSYVASALAFSIKRGGILYGTGGWNTELVVQKAVPTGSFSMERGGSLYGTGGPLDNVLFLHLH